MSLFICSECGTVDNTACSGYWVRTRLHKLPPLCSVCNPDLGVWHGHFDRQRWNGTDTVLNPDQRVSKDTPK